MARGKSTASSTNIEFEIVCRGYPPRKKQPLGIEYRIIAAEEISKHWSSQSFDLITACVSLQDMADVSSSRELPDFRF